jgi:hypothetical protein
MTEREGDLTLTVAVYIVLFHLHFGAVAKHLSSSSREELGVEGDGTEVYTRADRVAAVGKTVVPPRWNAMGTDVGFFKCAPSADADSRRDSIKSWPVTVRRATTKPL